MAKNQRVRRTLEWACAAARVAEKEGGTTGTSNLSSSSHSRKMRTREQQRPHRRHSQRHHEHYRGKHTTTKADGDLTEEEPDETVTPTGSWKDDHRWVARSDGAVQVATPPAPKISPEAQDDDVMRAALALCGLGRC